MSLAGTELSGNVLFIQIGGCAFGKLLTIYTFLFLSVLRTGYENWFLIIAFLFTFVFAFLDDRTLLDEMTVLKRIIKGVWDGGKE